MKEKKKDRKRKKKTERERTRSSFSYVDRAAVAYFTFTDIATSKILIFFHCWSL